MVQQPVRAALIDEYGETCRQVADFSPTAARNRELSCIIQSWYTEFSSESSFLAEGKLYSVYVSPRKTERSITSMFKLFGFLGKSAFLKTCKFTLKDVDAHVPAEEQEFLKLIESKATGTRSLKAVALSAAK